MNSFLMEWNIIGLKHHQIKLEGALVFQKAKAAAPLQGQTPL